MTAIILQFRSGANFRGTLTLDDKPILSFPGAFGDGSDGVVNLDGANAFAGFATKAGSVYTLTRPVFATTITVQAGCTLRPNAFPVYATVQFEDKATGIFEFEGAPGVVNAAGAAGATGTVLGGAAGGTGGILNVAGAAGVAAAQGLGGNGGAGGAGGAGAAGGAGGVTTTGGWVQNYRTPTAFQLGGIGLLGFIYQFRGGSGGGGGGGGAANNGGGGGAGGGCLLLIARKVIHDGTWRVRGGNGGTPTNGNGGGGGGGGGGTIYVMTIGAITGAGTTQYSGGTHGNHGPTGGNDGVDGAAGGLFTYDISA